MPENVQISLQIDGAVQSLGPPPARTNPQTYCLLPFASNKPYLTESGPPSVPPPRHVSAAVVIRGSLGIS